MSAYNPPVMDGEVSEVSLHWRTDSFEAPLALAPGHAGVHWGNYGCFIHTHTIPCRRLSSKSTFACCWSACRCLAALRWPRPTASSPTTRQTGA